jgi:FecR protein
VIGLGIKLLKIPSPNSNLVAAISLTGTVAGIATVLFAAEQKQARVTEVIHDVRLLAGQTAARPAVVNETVREGTAVRTGTDSRAELTFLDQTLTRLGANTVFSFGAAARTYDLGSGAVLMSAPKATGTVKITTAVATCAVSGFTAILERHSNAWNKFILLHGNGTLTLRGLPGDPCRLHTGQMVVFPPHPTHCPPVLNIDISKLLNGKLVKGFKGPLPELNIILADIENQQNQPPSGGLIDPTSQDVIDQAMNAHMEPSPPPRPTIIPSGARF